MKVIERNLQEIGKSLLVTLPKSWTKSMHLSKGSSIKISVSETGNLMIAPEFTKKETRKETIITYDDYFAKRFFQAYFQGNEKITIKNPKNIHAFLNKFMNVQIIEEIKDKIVVKVFKIDELSIEECLKRMFFLSLNIFDESDKRRLKELKNSLIKFYYMLVMQIRRFLSEGQFTEANQISLLRATDLRMVAEKIERISELLMNIERGKNLEQVKEFYNKSFNVFFNKEFDKSLPLMKEKKKFNFKNKDLQLLFSYANSIGMLTK